MIKLIDIGSDPEVFLVDKNSGKFVPAIGLIPGDKYNPYPVSKNGHAIQVDNVTAEICIPPANNPEDIYRGIQFSLRAVARRLPKNLKIAIVPSADFDPRDLENPIASEFGCSPDYDAYTNAENQKPNSNTTLRSSGGHIHIAFERPDEKRCLQLVKTLDLFLGVPSVILDKDIKRRQLYGKAGAFRYVKYGVEYRVLSNFWIASKQLVTWVYDNIISAIQFINEGMIPDEDDTIKIVDCINIGDIKEAKRICKKYNINYKVT